MSKREVLFGDIFNTWKVISKVEGKYNYNYICECIKCGSHKTISKYNLLNRTYALCEPCGIESVLDANFESIKAYWNSDLNGFMPDKSTIIKNPSVQYWFTCPKGHNFRKSIKDFSPGECHVCKKISNRLTPKISNTNTDCSVIYPFKDRYSHLLNHWNYVKNKDNPLNIQLPSSKKYWFCCNQGHEFQLTLQHIGQGKWCPHCDIDFMESRLIHVCKNVFSKLFKAVKVQHEFPIDVEIRKEPIKVYPDIIIEDIKLALIIKGEYHKKFNRLIHKTEDDFLIEVEKDIMLKKWLTSNGYKVREVLVTKNFDKDVDTIKQLVLELT